MTNITILGQQVQQLQRLVTSLSADINLKTLNNGSSIEITAINTKLTSIESQVTELLGRVEKAEKSLTTLTQTIDEKIKEGLKGVLETIDSLLNVTTSESQGTETPPPQETDDIVITTKKTITKKK